jgi:hypothetical protein
VRVFLGYLYFHMCTTLQPSVGLWLLVREVVAGPVAVECSECVVCTAPALLCLGRYETGEETL